MQASVALLLLISWIFPYVTGEPTTPASLEKWTYTCQSRQATCPVGFVVEVDELYMTTDRDCPTGSPELGPCQMRMGSIILFMQKSLCDGARVCRIIDVSGYLSECGITTFGIIIYRCHFAGFPLYTETTPIPTTTEPTPSPVDNSYCEPANLTCPKGQLVSVREVHYGAKTGPCEQTTAGCCAYDVTDCVERASSSLLEMQRSLCLNKEICSSLDLTDYVVFCNGIQYTSSYGIVKHSCYEAITSKAPTTKIPITKTPTTKTPTSKTTTTKTPTTKALTTKTPTTKTPTTTADRGLNSTSSPTSRPTPGLPSLNEDREIPESTHVILSLMSGGSPLGLLGTLLIKLGG